MEQALVSALAGAGPGDVGSEDAARAYLARTADARPKRYGGDTTCVEFQNAGGGRVLVDFGSGARRFGLEAMKSDRPISALMTHMHWDHVQGFPFFVPAFIPGRKLVIGGGHRPAALESALMSQFDTPFFPVPRSTVKADVDFFPVTAGEPFEFEGFTITAFLLNHGGGSYGYRFDYDGASVVFASDAEHDPNDNAKARRVSSRSSQLTRWSRHCTPSSSNRKASMKKPQKKKRAKRKCFMQSIARQSF